MVTIAYIYTKITTPMQSATSLVVEFLFSFLVVGVVVVVIGMAKE